MTGSSTSSMASNMIAYSNSAAAPSDSSAAGRAGRSRGVASKSKAAASTSALHAGFDPPPFDSEKLPPTLVSDIRRYLRVANQVEPNWPRAAYLCRFHAFERAHDMDPNSNGRGVRQFKTALLQQLEQDEQVTILKRKEKTDAQELKSLYNIHKEYIRKYGRDSESASRFSEQLINASEIASVLFDVQKTLTSGVGKEAIKDDEDLEKISVPYNILPLGPEGEQHPIMQLPEVKVAVSALRDVRGLQFPCSQQISDASFDLFDWLQFCFGFQKGNVANQREHLVMLLANMHGRLIPKQASTPELDERVLDELISKVFGNYKSWCKFLGRKNNLCLSSLKQEGKHQYKILYIGLYLLIWGEAANVRFLPECLCYIFHHMADELNNILSGTPMYGVEPESFLMNVISPLYQVIYKEAQKNKSGTADHTKWRNYDDLNEYFWSSTCFQLGWPMRLDNDFFYTSSQDKKEFVANENENPKWLGKTNFVEIRSFWHVFRSFERMWAFFILALQALIIMAWHDKSLYQLFNDDVFEDASSIFVTSSFLRLVQACLDIAFTWKARQTMSFSQILRYFLKLVSATTWTIILSVYYASTKKNFTCTIKTYWSGIGQLCVSSYMFLVSIYLISNVTGVIFFLVPAFNIYIETSKSRIFSILSWWAQPQIYVGRGIQERLLPTLKYTLFWMILLVSKFSFSYYFEIKPLVKPTKLIMRIGVSRYEWHELFPKVKNNAGAVVAVWAPVILVYFMDTQIWYAVFCTIFGGIQGVFRHLGEIRTMGMLRSRFESLPAAFNASLVPESDESNINAANFLHQKFRKVSESGKNGSARFAQVWNQIIRGFRSEDLISNREMDLMIIPMSSELSSGFIRWPVFLLATKLSMAMNMARDFDGKEMHLYKKLQKDKYMYYAVKECYDLLKTVLDIIIVGDLEKRVLSKLIHEVETSISNSTFLEEFKLSELPVLHQKCIQLVELLFENKCSHRNMVVKLLQDIFEIVTNDMMVHGSRILEDIYDFQTLEMVEDTAFARPEPQLFSTITLPLPNSTMLKEQIRRLLLLLTVKETAMDVPRNLEARRRISFFATSLFMDIPTAPKVQSMLSFSILTPYFTEEVTFSEDELHSLQDGASIFVYMQEIYPDEWKFFLERIESEKSEGLFVDKTKEMRKWASFRGQTLSRTVRGMMYYRKALKLQAFLDMAEDEEILGGYVVDEAKNCGKNRQQSLASKLDALVDMKFSYVLSCQVFGAQRTHEDIRAQDILELMIKYPSLRVAYIEEKDVIKSNKLQTVYSSILIKAVNKLDQEIYRIKLPGPPFLGEGKPENQNHSIIFTRGDAVQTIDMNQDCYMEEALKIRNVLQEFVLPGDHPPTILGLREHIFTGSVSSLASFMSSQETSFVTIGQRLLASPLRVRFHYGHPDFFDRLFHITRGGISKASKTVNLSDDVFGGFNSTLRQGNITYHEYMQVGKGRDVGLNQISKFEAKIANGNSEQTLSRDIYRLGHRLDFFRMISCYFTTIGFYFNSLVSILGVYIFLYGQIYLILSGLDKALLVARAENVQSLETALASESFIQLGLLTGLPMVMEIGLEKGFQAALSDFFLMQLQLAAVFFTFSLGTKAHYYGRTLLHGGAKYRHTGRKFVVFHASFTENYRLYSRSHFVKGFELMILLIVYHMFRQSFENNMKYVLVTYSIWFMAGTWLFAPFLFNPSGFQWSKIVEDWKDWNRWIKNQGGIGVHSDKSWESWWNDEQAHLKQSGWGARIVEIVLSLRFLIYQYGLVYHLDISQHSKDFIVYVLSWFVIGSVFLLLKILSEGRRRLSVNFHLLFRLFKAVLFLGIVCFIVTLFITCQLSAKDFFTCCLAFLPTGWGLLQIAQAVRPMIEQFEIWEFVKVFAQAYDYGMGVLLFSPVAALGWIPVISACQTRFLFNEAFNRHLKIQQILSLTGKMKK